jgi:hypothetical protein
MNAQNGKRLPNNSSIKANVCLVNSRALNALKIRDNRSSKLGYRFK